MEDGYSVSVWLVQILRYLNRTYECAGNCSDMINHSFRDLLDNGVIAFIDNILIYVKDEKERDRLVEEILTWLSQNDLVISVEKCTWSTQ
jgi:hypothetical protein